MWLDTRMAALRKRKWREGMAEFQAEGIEKAAQRRSKDATKEWVCYKECMSLGRERATRGHFEAIFLGVFLGMTLK